MYRPRDLVPLCMESIEHYVPGNARKRGPKSPGAWSAFLSAPGRWRGGIA